MSKKIKGVAFDSSHLGSYEDARASFKHQALLQDHLELQKETEAARNKLEAMKLKKLTLQAEVRFLRRRHKFLSENKSSAPQEHAIVKPRYIETNRYRKNTNEKFCSKKEAALRNINQNGRAYTEKKNALLSVPSHVFEFDLNQKDALPGVIVQSLRRATQASDPNQRVRTNLSRAFDLNKQETIVQTRAPKFDLNQVSRGGEEEEELQEGCERKGSVGSVVDEKLIDLKPSICRNIVRDGSTSRAGKRKISWQDPVALRV